MKQLLIVLFFFLVVNELSAQSDTIIAIQTKKNELVYSVDKNQKVLQGISGREGLQSY